jgi:hypothetical protein
MTTEKQLTLYQKNLLDEIKTGHNRRLAKKRVQCLNEALRFVSSSVLADNFVLRNPLLRQAPKRYAQFYDDSAK